MKYTLTGNFQYDLGIFGLKKILDFFNIEYQSDGKFYIDVNKTPEEILELIILKLVLQKKLKYFFDKVAKDLKLDLSNKDNELEKLIKEKKSIEESVNFITNAIHEKFQNVKKDEIEGIIWNKVVNLVNNVLLNFQADTKSKGKEVLEKAKEKFKFTGNEQCSFCGQKPARRISRDTFFFAPAQSNAFWFGEPSIFICNNCIAANLAITESFNYLGNSSNAVVIYTPNLKDLENLNFGLSFKFESILELTKSIIEYEKLKLKEEAAVKDLQIIEFHLDHKNPNLEFYMLTDEVITNLIKISDEIEKLYTDYKSSLFGLVKSKKVDFSKEILTFITQNQKLLFLVLKFAKLAIMSNYYEQKNVRNPPLKGFNIHVLLMILKMHFKLEGIDMNYFEEFKEYGQKLRSKVAKSLLRDLESNNFKDWYPELKKQNKENTFHNKIITLSNAFLDASKGSLQQFMETLTRVIISYDAPINANLLNMINQNTYREIATTIALSLLAFKGNSESEAKKEDETIEESNAL
jgi:CRISPR-associated protein Cst1